MMSAYALVRIKNGALVYQDFQTYHWPPEDGPFNLDKLAGVPGDTVFRAEKRISSKGAVWSCRAPGAGIRGDYGNGAILVRGLDAEMLTPMRSEPFTEYERQSQQLRMRI